MVTPAVGPSSKESPSSNSKSVFRHSLALMMEVDMQSPPPTFRPIAFAVKRPRSPGSPTHERQTKRLSLAPAVSEAHCVRRASTALDGVAGHDDWVRQAKELSIASPLSVAVGFPSSLADSGAVAPSRVDEHMAVDYEEPHVFRVHVNPGSSRPWTTKSHLPSIHITTTPAQASLPVPSGLHAPSPAPFSVLTEPPSSSPEPTSSTSSISVASGRGHAHHPRPPDIFFHPATPTDPPSYEHRFATDDERHGGESEPGPLARMQDQGLSQSSLIRPQDRRDGSSRVMSSNKRHRVTMGPRADCVKCRTGVRGHWMHFD